jgi:hypothetical protein
VAEHDTKTADKPATVLQRMLAAKISEDRALQHLRTDWVRSGGEVVTDPDAVVPRFVISPPPVTEHT